MVAETKKAMTLDDAMKLEGRELDAAVAERIGIPLYWHEYLLSGDGRLTKCGPYLNPQNSGESVNHQVPAFSTDWSAAMQVREWARASEARRRPFTHYVLECLYARSADGDIFLDTEPIDYARAALLVSP